MLQAINDRWMDHLQLLDYVREGIGLRSYGQVDPLIAYKRETYDLFQNTITSIRNQAVKYIFRAMPMNQNERFATEIDPTENIAGTDVVLAANVEPTGVPGDWPDDVNPKLVGRNDVCPCGSGMKFKNCHYSILRETGLI
jgi:preprotein translocase subunit SecA